MHQGFELDLAELREQLANMPKPGAAPAKAPPLPAGMKLPGLGGGLPGLPGLGGGRFPGLPGFGGKKK